MADDPDEHGAVLAALKRRPHDRPEVLADVARATLRRVPETVLRSGDPDAIADRILSAFTVMDERRPGEARVRITRPSIGLDGRPATSTVIEIATEDRPLLLSTVTDELERRGLRILRSLHPIVGAERGPSGHLDRVTAARHATSRESVLQLEVAGRHDPGLEDELATQLRALIADVVRATDDHDAMRRRIREAAADLRSGRWPAEDPDEAHEVAELLGWILDDNLVLLGVREYEVVPSPRGPALTVAQGSGLGLLSDERRSRYASPVPISELDRDLQRRIADAPLLTVTRTTSRSTVQRRERMEYLGLTRRGPDGHVERELRILGLFTRKGLTEPSGTTPLLRRKLATVKEREDVVDGSHDAITLVSLFHALPKDELFHADTDELHRLLVDLLRAEQHGETRALLRLDERTRTASVLVMVPRDRYDPELRRSIQTLLSERFGTARIDVDVSLGDRQEVLARFLVHLEQPVPQVSARDLQAEIRSLARTWLDAVEQRLLPRVGATRTAQLVESIGARLPRSYRELRAPAAATADILLVDAALTAEEPLLTALLADDTGAGNGDGDGDGDVPVRLRAVKRGPPLELSAFLPILESLGLTVVEEVPHRLTGPGPDVTLHDFGVRATAVDADADGPRLSDAALAAWRGHLVVDALNELVLVAGLDWRDVAVLRAYRRLRRQLGTAYTPAYTDATLVANPVIVTGLVRYFHARFDPHAQAHEAERDDARRRVLASLDDLRRLDHDRILRGVLQLIDATVRTNAFRADAVAEHSGAPYISLKLDPGALPEGVPRPVPHREIFVHSPEVEGVHLRAGPVARGGLRWSDRRDDVRTEVLDLLKAQVLKNAVIVPTGAKGGFVLANEPGDAAERRREVRRQYVTFVRGLLDVTDDLEGDEVVAPPNVLRHDGDDPYLVVAPDRGTAELSDTANELASRYGFWLDDAFASGGSHGYDHKELGVTARGAWVAIQRHFRELGVDVQSEPISIVGVGDMSGDVFGNALLRSRSVELVAAFDHRHIFLDPDPDPGRAYDERRRLFDLPRSSWDDYDRKLLSEGGAIEPRDAREIVLSDQVRERLRIDAERLTPPELIRELLRAPVDLLFAGGIGTYVRASDEPDAEVGDRANDELRVTAADVRARVIGEGANLFATQRARIEYARHGGHCNQDAIDNAGGVVTSDTEVNLKILLRLAEDVGQLEPDDRDEVLGSLSDEVVATVLHTVDVQAAALSRELTRSPAALGSYRTLLERLEAGSGLDRGEQVLPSDDELTTRAQADAGLTRPELATLLAWAKRENKEALLDSDVPDDPVCVDVLHRAFPPTAARRFADLLPRHRLRRELIATGLANDVVDRLGVTFASELANQRGVPLAAVLRCVQLARTTIDADRWWHELDELDRGHDPERVRELEAPLERLLGDLTLAAIDELELRPTGMTASELADEHRPVVSAVLEGLSSLGTTQQRQARTAHARWLIDDLVEPGLARFLACARDLALVPTAAAVLRTLGAGRAAATVMDALLRVGDALHLDRLEDALQRVRPATGWGERQHRGLAADLRRRRHDAVIVALRDTAPGAEHEAIDAFLATRQDRLAVAAATIGDVERVDRGDLDAIGVAERAIREVIEPRRPRP